MTVFTMFDRGGKGIDEVDRKGGRRRNGIRLSTLLVGSKSRRRVSPPKQNAISIFDTDLEDNDCHGRVMA
jgi:hypothetical protein